MRRFRPFLLALSLLFSAAAPAGAASSGKTIPPAPYYYVLDEPKVLDQGTTRALQALLIEHDRATGEQVLVAIFDSLGEEDVVDFTNRVFQTWKVGLRGKDNGVLLALYWKDHKSRIEVGYGLEPVLTDARSKQILVDFLKPELQAGHFSRGVSLTAMEILRTLGSPLVANGEAERILRAGGFQGGWHATGYGAAPSTWFVWVFLGIILVIIVLNLVTSAEAHFTSGGWHRPRPWDPLRRRGGWGGGFGGFGGFGGWGSGGGGGWGGGGGGGFIGGGGSSGGGGASGDW